MLIEEFMGVDNIVYKWGEMVLQVIVNDMECFNFCFMVIFCYFGFIFVAVFDVWLCYDEQVLLVYFSDVECQFIFV